MKNLNLTCSNYTKWKEYPMLKEACINRTHDLKKYN